MSSSLVVAASSLIESSAYYLASPLDNHSSGIVANKEAGVESGPSGPAPGTPSTCLKGLNVPLDERGEVIHVVGRHAGSRRSSALHWLFPEVAIKLDGRCKLSGVGESRVRRKGQGRLSQYEYSGGTSSTLDECRHNSPVPNNDVVQMKEAYTTKSALVLLVFRWSKFQVSAEDFLTVWLSLL